MNRIPLQLENPVGFHAKYHIQKIEINNDFQKSGIRYKLTPTPEGAEYFVLRLDENGKDLNHVRACRIAIHAYADAIEKMLPLLAKDLRERYPAELAIEVCDHERIYSDIEGYAYCNKCGVPMQ